jgi:HD-GYP domain-containing protein (c-di-GMP phosphodiesterase class II)
MPSLPDNLAVQDLRRQMIELATANDALIDSFVRAMDLREGETPGHGRRVANMTAQLARLILPAGTELIHMRHGALLHDIGKMGVPESILHKPGPLDEQEWAIMRRHPQYGFDLLSPVPFMRAALEIPLAHHERWDGIGYPNRLKGEQIPLSARIFAVVDVWDSLTSDRPYRPAWQESSALPYVASQAGTHFDPHIVDVFLNSQLFKPGLM